MNNKMPEEIYADATILDAQGLKNAFGQWICGKEPSDPFNTSYTRTDIAESVLDEERREVSELIKILEMVKSSMDEIAETLGERLTIEHIENHPMSPYSLIYKALEERKNRGIVSQ